MRAILVLASLAFMGCSETGIRAEGLPVITGNPAPIQTERITDSYRQNIPKTADILFVISNWWSSQQLQEELIEAFDEMLLTLIDSGVDYHIGVISTDTDHFDDNGKLREGFDLRWIDTETRFPIPTFTQMATMDAVGCAGPRRPRDATYMALEIERNGWNLGFRRRDASMHTVFVSDERDDSYHLSFDEWVDWYGNYTDTPDLDTLSTIVDLGRDTVNPNASQQIGGTVHDIDDLPWTNALNTIGLRVRGPRTMFNLTRLPVDDTLEVWVYDGENEVFFEEGPQEEGGKYAYLEDQNAILFHTYRPPSAARVDISYIPR